MIESIFYIMDAFSYVKNRYLSTVQSWYITDWILTITFVLVTKTLLYGDDKFDVTCNKSIKYSAIEFIVPTERFSNSLVLTFIFKR